ncbi:substrate-binding domain-containing protein [Crenalkalicoccus roseus]|uniref:substrate-binding domain-containing protein n=1 Tax=Crenalkalicoccus roseus TaxID=1485588 RepID=UPI0010817870|nr:substrate-binding domain-containing protein [Crenalkalicoccus roseus]
MHRRTALALSLALPAIARHAAAAEPVRAYGPGGPAPAMRAAASAFRQASGIAVEVTAGPTPQWRERAQGDADLLFSGAEYMMSEFLAQFRDQVDTTTVTTLYLRPSALLVRKGNPRRFAGLRDLLARPREESRLIVTQGAGQVAMWEDVAGRTGEVALVRAMRERIALLAPNSAAALQAWRGRPEAYDAWLIWNIWQVANPDDADLVEIEEPLRIWRSTGTVLTRRGAAREEAQRFVAFLAAPEGAAIFRRFGWSG